jgi:histidyl-tRNA synthetase
MQLLPGFRDFYPEDCARRNYILSVWREVASRYGFAEYDGPVLEPIDLYRKKSGGELLGQLFDFVDKGERHVALRPEMTPTLARMVAARERDYKKPLKWFCAPSFFRYEKQQRGRLREFLQLNCDILGDATPAADAELLALLIDILRGFGLGPEDFVVRLSDRDAWLQFARGKGVEEGRLLDFLGVVDKLERAPEAESRRKLEDFGIPLEAVRAFIANPEAEASKLHGILADLKARGMEQFVTVDLTIVRGLAYYTGLVFEVFDRGGKERALAGGGRYDALLEVMSDGKVRMPALGFGMGDVVLANLVAEVPNAAQRRDKWLAARRSAEVYIVVAEETKRLEALQVLQQLRDAGWRTDYAMAPAKVGKQFQAAESLGAKFAVIVGAEWPEVKVKELATRSESTCLWTDLTAALSTQAAH